MTKKLWFLLLALLLVGSACSGLPNLEKDVANSDLNAPEEVPAGDPEPDITPDAQVSLDQAEGSRPPSSLADVVEKTLPSVVNVRVTALRQDPFGETSEGRGQGSGVIIDPKGIILTNNHVVAGATKVTVVFNDGRDPAEGVVVGTEPEKDLAVIKVGAEDLTAIELGKSETLRLGDDVVALGFPLGLGGVTVTKGIVSAVNRTIRVGEEAGTPNELRDLLQTDAAINPGNSGGALIDLAGRLVGINTAAAGASFAENIGFAIPVDRALPVAERILEKPDDRRPWLGVSIHSVVSSADAGQLDLPADARGAYVVEFYSDSAAEEAGMEQGDLIVKVDDEEVASATNLSDILEQYDPGDSVEIEVLRDGEPRTFDVQLGTRPPGV